MAVKYRIYRWFSALADVTGTEHTTSVQGYNRFHLRAIDASGKLSDPTPYVFFYPPDYGSSEVNNLPGQDEDDGRGQDV
jgi:hypothetical protein